ncbi:MAG: ABC transporter ATP-binding protein [Acidimicrobiales bacterium]
MALLEVRDLVSGYRHGAVLHGVDFDLDAGEVVAVLGRNGMGKTTFVMTLMGLVRPTTGTVRFSGRELAGTRADVMARAGLALVPQGRRVFAPLSVDDHLALAARFGRPGEWTAARLYELLPGLAARRGHRGNQLSGGEQQMLAIARALITNPSLLLLDEPSEGLAPTIVAQVGDVIRRLADGGTSMVLVEQDLHLAFSVASEVAVMEKGRFVHRTDTPSFRRDPATARRLLGVG